MKIETEIIYRKGLPTKKSLLALISEFDNHDFELRLKLSSIYPSSPRLIWSSTIIQGRIYEFIDFAIERGLSFGKIKDYDSLSASVGSLEILNKTHND